MAEEEDIPMGCVAPLKKLDSDLKSGAEQKIIDEDVADLKKCLQTNQSDSEKQA